MTILSHEWDGTCHTVDTTTQCLKNGGCIYEGNYIPFNEVVNSDSHDTSGYNFEHEYSPDSELKTISCGSGTIYYKDVEHHSEDNDDENDEDYEYGYDPFKYIRWSDDEEKCRLCNTADIENTENYYCGIGIYSYAICSDGPSYEEYFMGWFDKETDKQVTESHKYDEEDQDEPNPCEDSRYDKDNGTCICSGIPLKLEDKDKNITCHYGLGWLCHNEKGCKCGELSCEKDHFCLAPGQCSRGMATDLSQQ